MIKVFSGDNQAASREAYLNTIQQMQEQKGLADKVDLLGDKVTLPELQQAIDTMSFFSSGRLVCIENLLSRRDSKEKKEILSYLTNYTGDTQIILWEKQALTPSVKKKISTLNHQEFKFSQKLFTFLDSIKPGNYSQSISLLNQTLLTESPELVFAMLIRQIRLLIQVADKGDVRLAPWQRSRLEMQARALGLKTLLKFHDQLLQIDIDQKSSNKLLSLEQNLDRLILSI